ncbi:MAG TPA: response regulator [Nitrososphaeraceae archaeon]|nr:response regulator [Nitrososphaeraceae archaeon]
MLYIFKEALELNSFRVCEFTSFEEALSYITKNPADFDLIISDYRMPDINGNDLCTKLLTFNSSLNIILMTAFHAFKYNLKFKFIGKSIPISKLLIIVKETLDQTKRLVYAKIGNFCCYIH